MPSTQEALVISSVLTYLHSKEGDKLEYESLFGVFSLAHSMHCSSSVQGRFGGSDPASLQTCSLLQALHKCLERIEQFSADVHSPSPHQHASGAASPMPSSPQAGRQLQAFGSLAPLSRSFTKAEAQRARDAPCQKSLAQQRPTGQQQQQQPSPRSMQHQGLHNLAYAFSKAALRDALDRREAPAYLDYAFVLLTAAFCCHGTLEQHAQVLPQAWAVMNAQREAALPSLERSAAGRRQHEPSRLLALFLASPEPRHKLAAAGLVLPPGNAGDVPTATAFSAFATAEEGLSSKPGSPGQTLRGRSMAVPQQPTLVLAQAAASSANSQWPPSSGRVCSRPDSPTHLQHGGQPSYGLSAAVGGLGLGHDSSASSPSYSACNSRYASAKPAAALNAPVGASQHRLSFDANSASADAEGLTRASVTAPGMAAAAEASLVVAEDIGHLPAAGIAAEAVANPGLSGAAAVLASLMGAATPSPLPLPLPPLGSGATTGDATTAVCTVLPAALELCVFAVLAPLWVDMQEAWTTHGLKGLLRVLNGATPKERWNIAGAIATAIVRLCSVTSSGSTARPKATSPHSSRSPRIAHSPKRVIRPRAPNRFMANTKSSTSHGSCGGGGSQSPCTPRSPAAGAGQAAAGKASRCIARSPPAAAGGAEGGEGKISDDRQSPARLRRATGSTTCAFGSAFQPLKAATPAATTAHISMTMPAALNARSGGDGCMHGTCSTASAAASHSTERVLGTLPAAGSYAHASNPSSGAAATPAEAVSAGLTVTAPAPAGMPSAGASPSPSPSPSAACSPSVSVAGVAAAVLSRITSRPSSPEPCSPTSRSSPHSPQAGPSPHRRRSRWGTSALSRAPSPHPAAVPLLVAALARDPTSLAHVCPEALALAARMQPDVLRAVAHALAALSRGQMMRPELWRGASLEVLCGQLSLLGVDLDKLMAAGSGQGIGSSVSAGSAVNNACAVVKHDAQPLGYGGTAMHVQSSEAVSAGDAKVVDWGSSSDAD